MNQSKAGSEMVLPLSFDFLACKLMLAQFLPIQVFFPLPLAKKINRRQLDLIKRGGWRVTVSAETVEKPFGIVKPDFGGSPDHSSL